MVITEIKHLNVRISQFEDNIFDKNILPIFTTPLILKEVDARKKSKYKIETLNPEKKLTFKIVSFNKIVEELAARINQIAIDLEPHYFIDPSYFNSLPINVRQFLEKKNLIEETKEIEEALLRIKKSTVKNKKLILYSNFILASRLLQKYKKIKKRKKYRNRKIIGFKKALIIKNALLRLRITKRSTQRYLYKKSRNRIREKNNKNTLRTLRNKRIKNKDHGINIKTMTLFMLRRNRNNTLLLKKKDILKYRVETLINFKKFNLAALLKKQSTINKFSTSILNNDYATKIRTISNKKGLNINNSATSVNPYLRSAAATLISGWIPTSKGALMLLEDEGWDLDLLSNINKTAQQNRNASQRLRIQRLRKRRTYRLKKIRRLRRLRRSRLMSINLYLHRSKNVKIIQKDQITQGRNHSKLNNEDLIKHNDNRLNFIINWIGNNLAFPSTTTHLLTQSSPSFFLAQQPSIQRLDKKNISEIFLAQYSKPLQLPTFEIDETNDKFYSSKSAISATLPFYRKPKQVEAVSAPLHLAKTNANLHLLGSQAAKKKQGSRNVNKEGGQNTPQVTANKTRQLSQGFASTKEKTKAKTQYNFSFLNKELNRNHNVKNRKFATLASSNFNIYNIKKIVQLNTLNLSISRKVSNVAGKGPNASSNKNLPNFKNKNLSKFKNINLNSNANAKKTSINQARFNLLDNISSSALRLAQLEAKAKKKKKEKLSTAQLTKRNTNVPLLAKTTLIEANKVTLTRSRTWSGSEENNYKNIIKNLAPATQGRSAFIYDDQIRNTSKNLKLIESKLLNWRKKKKFLEDLLQKTSQNFANSMILRKKIFIPWEPNPDNLTKNIKQSFARGRKRRLVSRIKRVNPQQIKINKLSLKFKSKFLKKIKPSVKPKNLSWEKANIALLFYLKSKPRLFWTIIKLYSSSFNPMLKSLNKGGVYTPLYLRLSGFSGNSAAQIKKLKKTAPTIQTMTNPSITKVSKKTAVLKSKPGKNNTRKLKGIQKYQSKLVISSTNAKQQDLTSGETETQIFNLEQQIKPKSLPLHTVNLLIYQLNRKLKTISQANLNKGNTTASPSLAYTKSKKKKKGGTIINTPHQERIDKIKEQILVLSRTRKSIIRHKVEKSKKGKLKLLTQASITPALASFAPHKVKRNNSLNLTSLQARRLLKKRKNAGLNFKKGSKTNLVRSSSQVLFKKIDNILAYSAPVESQASFSILEHSLGLGQRQIKSKLLPSKLESKALALSRNSDKKRFLFLYFIIPIFFATLRYKTVTPNRQQIILKNQKKQLHSLIKLMLSAGSVLRNKKKKRNFLSALPGATFTKFKKKVKLLPNLQDVRRPASATDAANLLKWSILFIAHSLTPLKKKQEYYSFIFIKILEAKGILTPIKKKYKTKGLLHTKLNIKPSRDYENNLERLAANFLETPVNVFKLSTDELRKLISNKHPEFKLEGEALIKNTDNKNIKRNKLKTEVSLNNTGITLRQAEQSRAVINSRNIEEQKKARQLKLLRKKWRINNLSIVKNKQGLLWRSNSSDKKKVDNSASPASPSRLKNKEKNQDLLLKINSVASAGEGDNALLQTELKKASITFYPGARFLSDWKRVTRVIWQEDLKFKSVYNRVNNSLYLAKNIILKKFNFWYAIIKIFKLWNIIKISNIKSIYSFKLQIIFLKFGLVSSIISIAATLPNNSEVTVNNKGADQRSRNIRLINLRLKTLAFKAMKFKEKLFYIKKKVNKSYVNTSASASPSATLAQQQDKERKLQIAYLQIKAKLFYQIRSAFKRDTGFNLFKFFCLRNEAANLYAAKKNLSEIIDINNACLRSLPTQSIASRQLEYQLKTRINQVNILDKIKYPILEIILKKKSLEMPRYAQKRFSQSRSSGPLIMQSKRKKWTLDKKLVVGHTLALPAFIIKDINLMMLPASLAVRQGERSRSKKILSLSKSNYISQFTLNNTNFENKGSLVATAKVAKAGQVISKENFPKQIAGQMINSLKFNTELKKSFNNLVFAKSTIIGKIRSIKLIELIDKIKEEIIIAEKLAALERVADITNLNLINKKQYRRINASKYLNKKNIYRSNRIKILQTIKTIKTDLRFEPNLDSNSLSIIPVSLLYYSNLKDTPICAAQNKKDKVSRPRSRPRVKDFKHKNSSFVQINSLAACEEIEKPPVLNAYLRDLSTYNRETKGTIKYFSKFIGYNFNTNTNKISNNIYDLLAASFKAMRCLISKPVFVITPDKITIQLFYFLLVASKPRLKKIKKRLRYNKNSRLRLRKIYKKARLYQAKNFDLFSLNKLFPKQFDLLCNILNKEFNKPVELNLTRLHYPSGDSNILVNLVGLIIHKVRTQRIFKGIFAGSIIKTLIKLKARKFNDITIIPAFLTGLNIKIAGRLMTQPMRPRKTINQIRRGASASGKINYLNFARLTKKNKRGSFSITISAGQNYFK